MSYSEEYGGLGPDATGTSFETADGWDLGPAFFLVCILFLAWVASHHDPLAKLVEKPTCYSCLYWVL